MVSPTSREFELVRGPSEAAWDELTELLEARRAVEELGPWVAALGPELARWPGQVRRRLPLRWIYRLAARGVLPEAALADTLVLSDRWALTRFAEFRRLSQGEDDAVEANGDEYEGVEPDDRSEQERVFEAAELAGIRRLDVSYFSEDNPLSPGPMVWLDSAAPLLAAAFMPGLVELDLSGALGSWEDPGEQLAALLRRAPALRCLDLSANALGDEALLVLAACPELRRLERLVLTGNDAGSEARAALRAAGLVGVIEDLDDEGEDDE